MKRYIAILICTYLAMLQVTLAGEWKQVGTSENKDVWYIDIDSISKVEDVRTFWAKIDHNAPQDYDGKTYQKTQTKVSINCSKQTYDILGIARVDSKGAVFSYDDLTDKDSNKDRPIVKSSVFDFISQYVCRDEQGGEPDIKQAKPN
jgi:hypothetical protein